MNHTSRLSKTSLQGCFTLAVFFSLVSLATAQVCVAPPSGLVSWWRGEGNANDTSDGNHGTLANGVTFVPGFVGQTFSFDGTGEVTIADNANLNVQALTIEAWVFPTVLDGLVDIILNKETDNTSLIQYEIGIRGSSSPGAGIIPEGNFAFFIGGISGLPDEFLSWVDGGEAVPLSTWTHVALAFDGSSAKAYVNGVLTRSIDGLSGSVNTLASPLRIGTRSDSPAPASLERFNGAIDEVSFYNRALAATEIEAIVTADSTGKCVPSAPVGGSVRGMSPTTGKVTCQNLTRPRKKTVRITLPAGVKSWDCGQAGLVVNQGDKIKQTITVTGPAD
jgi:hypothetical protein